MSEESDHSLELSSQQTEKVLQFQDLTGIEDFDRCKQILSAHNWSLETAVRFTIDGSIESQITSTSTVEPEVRHRSVAANTLQNNNIESFNEHFVQNNNNNNNNRAETQLSLWSLTTRLISFPFAFIYDTILSIFRFALSIIRTETINSTDSTTDLNRHLTEFETKYGSIHPVFFRGTYGQALNEAKRDLKFLLVYLHSDIHQNTPEFCNNILTNSQFIEFIQSNNLLFWSHSVRYSEGYRVSQSLRETTYPFLALIGLKNNRMVIIRKFEGKLTLDLFVNQLRKSIEDNEASLIAARVEREERSMNQRLREEQDEAYEESLQADKQKELRRRQEQDRRDAEESARRLRQLEECQRRERLLQLRQQLVHFIPSEPTLKDMNATKLVIKLPNGLRLERLFLKNESIKYLYYFVFCNPHSPINFQIRTNFPTRDLPGKAPSLEDFPQNKDIKQCVEEVTGPTFEECDLGRGAMLFVNDLES